MVPYIFVNWLSLNRHKLTFAVLVAMNLDGPTVVADAGRFFVVDLYVSNELAVKYVPLYSMKMSAKGFAKKKWCGRNSNVLNEACKDVPRGRRPLAFSIIALRISLVSYRHSCPCLRTH